MGYDRYPEKLIDEKAAVYKRAVAEDWLLFFTHDPVVSAAKVRSSEGGKFEPVQVQEALDGFTL